MPWKMLSPAWECEMVFTTWVGLIALFCKQVFRFVSQRIAKGVKEVSDAFGVPLEHCNIYVLQENFWLFRGQFSVYSSGLAF